MLLCTQQLAACRQAGTEQLPFCRPALQLLLQLRHHCSADLLAGLVPYLQAMQACSEAGSLHCQAVMMHLICAPILVQFDAWRWTCLQVAADVAALMPLYAQAVCPPMGLFHAMLKVPASCKGMRQRLA